MRNIMTVMAVLFIVVTGFSQPKWNERIPTSNPTNNEFSERKYMAFQLGIDPMNAFVGGKKLSTGERRNPKALDVIGRLSFGWETPNEYYFEVGVAVEVFDEINFRSIAIDLNYVQPIFSKLFVLIGIEDRIVSRKGVEGLPDNVSDTKESRNIGGNLRLRWEAVFGTSLFLESHLNYMYRSDIGAIWGKDAIPNVKDSLSSYISIGTKF